MAPLGWSHQLGVQDLAGASVQPQLRFTQELSSDLGFKELSRTEADDQRPVHGGKPRSPAQGSMPSRKPPALAMWSASAAPLAPAPLTLFPPPS